MENYSQVPAFPPPNTPPPPIRPSAINDEIWNRTQRMLEIQAADKKAEVQILYANLWNTTRLMPRSGKKDTLLDDHLDHRVARLWDKFSKVSK